VLTIESEEPDLPVELRVEGNLTLLFALFQVMNGGVKVLQRQAGAWLELGPVVMGEPHRQIVVHSLEVELMTNNDVLLIRLVGVEFLQALLCSSLYSLPVSAREWRT
jgi:hypothetical protein